MRHVEQSSSRIPLDTHILGPSKSSERAQSSRPSNLRLVFLMGSQIGDAAYGIALHLDVGGHHLPDKRSQASEKNYRHFVFGYINVKTCSYKATEQKKNNETQRTVDGKVP